MLVNRSLSDMHEDSQRCQHLQCLDRPLKPDPRKHTHPLGQHTWWDGMPTAIRLGKYPSENQTIAIFPLITSQHTHTHTHHTYLRRSGEDFSLWSLEGEYKNGRGGKLLCVILTELNTTLSGDKTMRDSTSKGLWVMSLLSGWQYCVF